MRRVGPLDVGAGSATVSPILAAGDRFRLLGLFERHLAPHSAIWEERKGD